MSHPPLTYWSLVRRSLRYHARAHVGVVLGAAIGTAALVGALLVGDSVRETLQERALARLGQTYYALQTQPGLFEASLRSRLAPSSPWRPVSINPTQPSYIYPDCSRPLSMALALPGVASRVDGSARANSVQVLGIEPDALLRLTGLTAFSVSEWTMNPAVRKGLRTSLAAFLAGHTAVLNERLATQLGVRAGDEIVVRVRKPGELGQDQALTLHDEGSVALRLKVGAVLPPGNPGNFSLSTQPLPPANLFLPLAVLQETTGAHLQANLLLFGPVQLKPRFTWWEVRCDRAAKWLLSRSGHPPARLALEASRMLSPALTKPVADQQAVSWLEARLQKVWRLEDADLSVQTVELPQSATGGVYIRPCAELTSARLFLEPSIAAAALRPRTTLLTNREPFRDDTRADLEFCQFASQGVRVLTYLANLIQAGDRSTPYSMVTATDGPQVPPDLRDDEIVVNQWLAEDLHVAPGDSLALSYYAPDSGRRLLQRTNSFRVRSVVPLKGVYADRSLMPAFPGLAKAESTHDWDAGFPLVYPIRDQDEAYWKQYRGTPKAFISLAAGQKLWANRFGNLTAIRYQVPTNSFASTYREAAYRNLLANLTPAELGLRLEPVRAQALRAAEQGQDFGQLFLGFSFFLVIAALLLMALLFRFGLEQRAGEVRTLLALGFTRQRVRRLFLAEGAVLALVGGVLGALGGVGYARAMLWGLRTAWRSAVGNEVLGFHATPGTLAVGLCASTVVAVMTIWATLRVPKVQQPTVTRLKRGVNEKAKRGGGRGWVSCGLTAGVAALALVIWSLARGGTGNAGAFFGAGALMLVSGLAWAAVWLNRLARAGSAGLRSVRALGVRGCARRRNRSLASIALLACGCFVVVAVGVFRLDANQHLEQRASGTGGFALLAQSTLPVVQDLHDHSGRDALGLNTEELKAVSFVPFRVRAGDDASCLNLNRAQQPRLLGVRPELLAGRFSFAQVSAGQRERGWELLPGRTGLLNQPIPAIADANTIEWGLGKRLGDTVDYTDEQGHTFQVRLVGAVAGSILQGSLIIDEAEFVRRFPNESGYRMWLVDAPPNSLAQVSATLSRALQDLGLELTPAAQRLTALNAVENTYLGAFQALGGLGLLLGSAGLGVVVLRNVLERRGELALLAAVGFRRQALERLVLAEHGALLGAGLGLGMVAAALAVWPAVWSSGAALPYGSLGLTLVGVWLTGLLWTWLGTRYALRGNLLAALRNE